MKKNILIVLLILISASFAVYAKIKASEAESAYLQLSESFKMAEHLSEESVQFQEKALNAVAEAVKQQHEAERLLAELQACQSN